jgi:hypothetical protein
VKTKECDAAIVKSGIEFMADFYDSLPRTLRGRGPRLLPGWRRYRR